MMFFLVLVDGDDKLRAVSYYHPSTVVRLVTMETGFAKLIWCSLAPAGRTPSQMVKEFDSKLARPLRNAGRTRILLTLCWEVVMWPAITAALRHLVGLPKRLLHRFLFRIGPGRSLKGSVVRLPRHRRL